MCIHFKLHCTFFVYIFYFLTRRPCPHQRGRQMGLCDSFLAARQSVIDGNTLISVVTRESIMNPISFWLLFVVVYRRTLQDDAWKELLIANKCSCVLVLCCLIPSTPGMRINCHHYSYLLLLVHLPPTILAIEIVQILFFFTEYN